MADTARRTRTDGTPLATAAVALAAAHHFDHVVRGDAGWPFAEEVNAFTWSLVLYPAFAAELVLARRGATSATALRFALAGVGLGVITVTHLGPVAVDRVDRIPSAHSSQLAGAAAAAITVALVVSLLLLVLQVGAAAGDRRRRVQRERRRSTASGA